MKIIIDYGVPITRWTSRIYILCLGNVSEDGVERMSEPKDHKDCYKIVSSGHYREATTHGLSTAMGDFTRPYQSTLQKGLRMVHKTLFPFEELLTKQV